MCNRHYREDPGARKVVSRRKFHETSPSGLAADVYDEIILYSFRHVPSENANTNRALLENCRYNVCEFPAIGDFESGTRGGGPFVLVDTCASGSRVFANRSPFTVRFHRDKDVIMYNDNIIISLFIVMNNYVILYINCYLLYEIVFDTNSRFLRRVVVRLAGW